ncbi:MAG: cobalamin biosynthesis protein [Micromonosporaceae bacterium]|nr:cobalamin biosynthesis protein [Micromonosporaceae bacterium]
MGEPVSRARAAGLVAGLLADAAAGDPRRGHPVAVFGAAAQRAEQACYCDDRLTGAVYSALLVGVPALAAWALERRLPRARGIVLAAVTWAALGGRSLGREALAVGEAVAAGDLVTARRRIPALVGRDPATLDGPELCRAAVESVAENTADAIVAPLLWGAVAGPAGVVAHRCANTLDAMVGYRSRRYLRFGWASARLDDVLAWAPARLTAALAVLLAPLVGGEVRAAARVARRDGHRSPSPNAGRAEAAFAGALGVRLGGVNRYGSGPDALVEVRGPLGDGPSPTPADVARAVLLSRAVVAAAALVAAAAAAAAGRDSKEVVT